MFLFSSGYFCNLLIHNGIFRVGKETECCSTEDMNTCRIVFKMELLFGDADITGILNAVLVL